MNADKKQEWELYLIRPFTLFGASIWNEWYVSPHTEEVFGMRFSSGLFVESPRGVIHHYRKKVELVRFRKCLADLALQPDKLSSLLEEGERLNAKAGALLDGTVSMPGLEKALDFYIRLALYATVLPLNMGEMLESIRTNDTLFQAYERLRSVS